MHYVMCEMINDYNNTNTHERKQRTFYTHYTQGCIHCVETFATPEYILDQHEILKRIKPVRLSCMSVVSILLAAKNEDSDFKFGRNNENCSCY